jgi:hypothetical protein
MKSATDYENLHVVKERPQTRHLELKTSLLSHICADLVPLVVAYAWTIHMNGARTIGQRSEAVDAKSFQYLRSFPEKVKWLPPDGDLTYPEGICVGEDEIFVSDTQCHQVQVFHQQSGRFLRAIRPSCALKKSDPFIAALHEPRRLLLLGNEVVVLCTYYVVIVRSDFTEARPRYINPTPIAELLNVKATLGIAANSQEIFVSYTNDRYGKGDHELHVLSRETQQRTARLTGQSIEPSMLFVEDQELFVVDARNSRVRVIDAKLRRPTEARYFVRQPSVVVVFGDQVIVSSTEDGSLSVFDRSSTKLVSKHTDLGLSDPTDMCLGRKHELFVCDTKNRRILVVT